MPARIRAQELWRVSAGALSKHRTTPQCWPWRAKSARPDIHYRCEIRRESYSNRFRTAASQASIWKIPALVVRPHREAKPSLVLASLESIRPKKFRAGSRRAIPAANTNIH